MTDREVVEYLAKHFIVKNGKMPGPYGNLELWWASNDVRAEPNAMCNPHMRLASVTNSYSLAAMGELKVLIDAARELCNQLEESDANKDRQGNGGIT